MRPSPPRRWTTFRLQTLGAALAVALAPTFALADDWPQYRGPDRTGISAETGLLTDWPDDSGPTELWRQPIGSAFTGLSVVGEALYTAESTEEGEFILRLDAKTGAEVWRARIADRYTNNFGDGPRSTPTVVGDALYVMSANGRLVSLATADGAERWAIDMMETFGAEQPRFGFSPSPLVLDGKLYVETGGADGKAVIAVDAGSGEVLWQAGDSPAAFSSPIHVTLADTPQLVVLNSDDVQGLGMDGSVLWEIPFAPGNGVKPAMPIFLPPDKIFVSASYDIGAMLVQVAKTADGWQASEVWGNRVMRNHFNTSVLIDGHLYGFDNSALKCIDAATGEQRWAKRGGLGKGSLVAADGHLVVLSETGKLLIVEATPEEYREKASAPVLSGRCWTSPTLAHGTLYLRNREEIVALDLANAPAPAPAAEPASEASDTRR